MFDRRQRRSVALVCFGGVMLSVWGATLAASHPAAGPWLVFLIPIIGLTVLGVGTLRGVHWAQSIVIVGLGGQIFGVIGVVWELAHFSESSEAAKVLSLGVDPLLGLLTNLAICLVCVALFVRAVLRLPSAPSRTFQRRTW
ncbi:MAG: hypothetical protein ABI469_11590 [Gemmatimonadales bacterium]